MNVNFIEIQTTAYQSVYPSTLLHYVKGDYSTEISDLFTVDFNAKNSFSSVSDGQSS